MGRYFSVDPLARSTCGPKYWRMLGASTLQPCRVSTRHRQARGRQCKVSAGRERARAATRQSPRQRPRTRSRVGEPSFASGVGAELPLPAPDGRILAERPVPRLVGFDRIDDRVRIPHPTLPYSRRGRPPAASASRAGRRPRRAKIEASQRRPAAAIHRSDSCTRAIGAHAPDEI